jgi:NADPH:quinone reductase-like Zn-dependent oxidoreductase
MRNTEGQGVDVVLNSLTGELLHASWKCVSEFGMMIELGKRDLIGHGRLDMEPFLKNRTYATVDISHMFAKRPEYSAR